MDLMDCGTLASTVRRGVFVADSGIRAVSGITAMIAHGFVVLAGVTVLRSAALSLWSAEISSTSSGVCLNFAGALSNLLLL